MKEEVKPVVEAPALEKKVESVETVIDNSKREQELTDLSSFIVKGEEEVEESRIEPVVEREPQRTAVVEERPIVTRSTVRQPAEEEEDEYDYSDYERELAEQRRKRNTWIGVGVAILLILGIGVWGYNNFGVETDVVPQANNNAQVRITDDKPAVAVVDDPVLPEEVAVTERVEEKEPEVAPVVASKPAQGSREIVVKSGQTMRALGQEYFGHRSFWVYIFEENRDRIKKPDDVFAGMKLTLPSTAKYDIDANNKASVSKAERLELKYFGEFSQK